MVVLRVTDADLRAISAEPQSLAAPAGDTVQDAPTAAPVDGVAATLPASHHGESLAASGTECVSNASQPADAVHGPFQAPDGASPRLSLRNAARSVLAAWDAPDQPDLAAALAALRAALPIRAPAPHSAATRQPRSDTKQATVRALLRRPEGASGPALVEATGWAPHTVRGFLAGLKKRGIDVLVHERVRQVGPNKAGAKGSYSIYRIAEVG